MLATLAGLLGLNPLFSRSRCHFYRMNRSFGGRPPVGVPLTSAAAVPRVGSAHWGVSRRSQAAALLGAEGFS